jgi:hypothetical protein
LDYEHLGGARLLLPDETSRLPPLARDAARYRVGRICVAAPIVASIDETLLPIARSGKDRLVPS